MTNLTPEAAALCQTISEFISGYERSLLAHYAGRFARGLTTPHSGFRQTMRLRESSGTHGYRLTIGSVARDISLAHVRFRASPDLFLPVMSYLLDTYPQVSTLAGNNQIEFNLRVLGEDDEAARLAIIQAQQRL